MVLESRSRVLIVLMLVTALQASGGACKPVLPQAGASIATVAPTNQLWQVVKGSIFDGDTFRVTDGSRRVKVRLCGVDAPEKRQRLGLAARDKLRSLLADGQVRLVETDRDRYGRTVAEVFTPSGQFINAELVRVGMAWYYPRYSRNCPNRVAVIRAEAEARADRLGVFRPGNLPPWIWRKQVRR